MPGAQLVEFGLADAQDVAAVMRRLSTTTEIAAAVATADYVVEAVVEDLAVKRAVIEEVDRHTLAAWAPPSAGDPTGPCARLTIQHAIG